MANEYLNPNVNTNNLFVDSDLDVDYAWIIQVNLLNTDDMYFIVTGKINVLLIVKINLCIWIVSLSVFIPDISGN